ncbi:MAG: hypothetical protein ACFNVI_03720, partial [Lachnoanaerobaculum gingivalis]
QRSRSGSCRGILSESAQENDYTRLQIRLEQLCRNYSKYVQSVVMRDSAGIVFVFVVDKISRDRLRNNREIYEETANPKSYKQQEKIDEKEKSFSREEGT